MKSRIRAVLVAGLIPLEWLAAVLLFMMMAVTFADVVGRYAFNEPIYGSAEIIQFLLAGTVFVAFGLVSADDAHIGVDLLAPGFRNRMPWLQPLLVSAVSVVGLLAIGWQLLQLGLDALATDRRTIVLEWSYAGVALPGAALCLYAAVLQAYATWGRLVPPHAPAGSRAE